MEKNRLENLVESNPEQNIPGFEHLSEKDKKFVLEIKHLSEISEEEFFKENPKFIFLKEKVSAFRAEKDWTHKISLPTVPKWFLQNWKENRMPSLGDLKDNPEYWATMWELVRIHLLELEDFHKFGAGFYGKQTIFLAEQLVGRLVDINFNKYLPDGKTTRYRDVYVALMRENMPTETKDQIAVISRILNIFHEKAYMDNMPPVGLCGLKDLWRYVLLQMRSSDLNHKGEGRRMIKWFNPANNFLDQLSNISWKEDKK